MPNKKYIVYYSNGTIMEQEAASSSYLKKMARIELGNESGFSAAVCKRMEDPELQHDTPIWIMTHNPFDGFQFSRFNTDRAHKHVARQAFLYENAYGSEWITNVLFEMGGEIRREFTLDGIPVGEDAYMKAKLNLSSLYGKFVEEGSRA